MAAVECIDVSRTYGSGETAVPVLRGLDLTVEEGTLVALYGPSGSGKTTLLNLIGALDLPTEGTVKVLGQDIVHLSESARTKLRRTELGFVFQSYALLPTYSALENIDLALRLLSLGYRERQQRAKSALDAVGLGAWSSHMPDELSGGQRQRVAIARALAARPRLMLADEPTGGLDTRTTRRVLALFRGVAQGQGTTFVIVSHDPLVAEHVDLAYDLHDGKLIPRAIENSVNSQVVAAVGDGSIQEGEPEH
ncbi:MAG: ABC transporter ATP-binding protein [Chloroflexota bacterium]